MLKSLPNGIRPSKFSIKHFRRVKKLKDDFEKLENELEQPIEFLDNVFTVDFVEMYKEYVYESGIKYYGEFRSNLREGKGLNI